MLLLSGISSSIRETKQFICERAKRGALFAPAQAPEPGGEPCGLGPGSSDSAQSTFPGRGQAQPTRAFLE